MMYEIHCKSPIFQSSHVIEIKHGADFQAMLPGNHITGSVCCDWMIIYLLRIKVLQERQYCPVAADLQNQQHWALQKLLLSAVHWLSSWIDCTSLMNQLCCWIDCFILWRLKWLCVIELAGYPDSGSQTEPRFSSRGPGPQEPTAGAGEDASLLGGEL